MLTVMPAFHTRRWSASWSRLPQMRSSPKKQSQWMQLITKKRACRLAFLSMRGRGPSTAARRGMASSLEAARGRKARTEAAVNTTRDRSPVVHTDQQPSLYL